MKKILALALLFAAGPFLFLHGQKNKEEEKAIKEAEKFIEFEEFGNAAGQLRTAVQLNPNNPQSQYLLGYCYYQQYQKKSALTHLEKAWKMQPEVAPDLPYYYANALQYNLRFDDAIPVFKKAQSLVDPADPRWKEIELSIRACIYAKKAVANPNGARIENIGPPVNTQWSEHSPVISADESVMLYTTVRPDNQGCNGDPLCELEDIYVAENKSDKWVNPKPAGDAINTKNMDATIGLSPDGQTLFIYKDPPGNGDIFKSVLKGTTWGMPASLGDHVNSKNWEEQVSMSPDGQTLYFTSDRPGGQGKMDIWMSSRDAKGEWSDPINLGPTINTPEDDRSPFIHPNGRTLYFSSMGRPDCLGGHDIFVCELQPDGTWGAPSNIGFPINTPDDDIYFVLSADGRHGYYSSAKEGGYGEKDIYRIIMPEPKVEVVAVQDTFKPVVVQNQLTILKGTVTDAITKAPVEAEIQVINNETGGVIALFNSNSATGKYLVSLPSGKNYGIRVQHPDYLFHSENFDIPKATGYQEVTKDVELKKVAVGSTIVLRNIFFDYDKATLRPQSQAELDRLHKLLTELPGLVIEIGGHTDSDGSEEYNQKLSEARAKSVVNYLIEKGIKPERLSSKGYGESVPVDTNSTPEGKQNNRRTEFKILQFNK
jgi:outer membrane protein OmpA-like peptidoglycan-associated protein